MRVWCGRSDVTDRLTRAALPIPVKRLPGSSSAQGTPGKNSPTAITGKHSLCPQLTMLRKTSFNAINRVMKTSPHYTFKCTRCGRCCHYGKNEYVKITKREYSIIGKYLNVSPEAMLKQYAKIVGKDILLRRKNYKCILLVHNACSIQSVKPVQCKTWPYWKENYHKLKFKRHVMVKCKGIMKGGRTHPQPALPS